MTDWPISLSAGIYPAQHADIAHVTANRILRMTTSAYIGRLPGTPWRQPMHVAAGLIAGYWSSHAGFDFAMARMDD